MVRWLFFTVACITSAHAVPVTLTFNLPDLVPNVPEEIDGYYSGSTDAGGAVEPNYGIAFAPTDHTGSGNTLSGYALIDTANPSPQGGNSLVFPLAPGAASTTFLIDAAGTDYLSFNYLGNGVDGLLAGEPTVSRVLTPLGSSGWTHEDVTFAAPVFTFVFQNIGPEPPPEYANVTMNGLATASVPEHTGWETYGLAGLGLLGMCWVFRRREKAII